MTTGKLTFPGTARLGCFCSLINWAAGLLFPFGWIADTESENSILTRKNRVEFILKTEGNAILRLAYTYLHNSSDAEEVLQDTLIQYMRKAPVFMDSDHERAWLMRVAVNLSKNLLRRNRIRQTEELNDNLIANQRPDLSYVWDGVKRLPQRYREVIHLYYYEQLTTAQIAQILRRRESTIRSDLYRGRMKLREQFKEDFDDENGI